MFVNFRVEIDILLAKMDIEARLCQPLLEAPAMGLICSSLVGYLGSKCGPPDEADDPELIAFI